MPFTLKTNEPEARERLRAFWRGESVGGRPALIVEADNPTFVDKPWRGPTLDTKGLDLLPEWHAWCADQHLRRTLFLAEAMPGVTPCWGSHLVTVSTLVGADYEYHGGSAWIRPIPDVYERPLPVFDPEHPVARSIEHVWRRTAEVVGSRGFVNGPVFMDPYTTLSQFRTPQQLCLDVVERPEDVFRWGEALSEFYVAAHNHFYRLVKSLGYGDSTTWLQVMAEGRMEAVQCDFAVMLSPEMYGRFVMPDLRRVTQYLDFSLYHLDGTCQRRFLDLLGTLPKLNGIQWNPEPPAGSPVQWLDALKDIRRRGWSLYVWASVDDAVVLASELGPDGLCLALPRFRGEKEAGEAIKAVHRAG